jgi:hypothetical protein
LSTARKKFDQIFSSKKKPSYQEHLKFQLQNKKNYNIKYETKKLYDYIKNNPVKFVQKLQLQNNSYNIKLK